MRTLLLIVTTLLFGPLAGLCCFAQSKMCNEVVFPASFSDEKDQPVMPSADDIRIRIGDDFVHQHSIRVSPISIPTRTVIVLDLSGSMREGWDGSILSAIGMVKASSPTAPIGLVAFNDKIAMVPISSDHAELERQLLAAQYVRPKGRSSIFDAIELGIRMLTPGTVGDALFVVSDGGDNHSRTKYESLRKEIVRSRTRMFLVAPVDPMAEDPEDILGPSDLISMAQESGGEIFRFYNSIPFKEPSRSKVMAQLLGLLDRKLYPKLLHPQQIEIAVPSDLVEKSALKIELIDTAKFGKSIKTIAPKSVYPCGKQLPLISSPSPTLSSTSP